MGARGIVLSFLFMLAEKILRGIAQSLWDGVWAVVFEGIAYAEEHWKESGYGEKKREYVIGYVMEYINERAQTNWLYRQILRLFIGQLVDTLIVYINEEIGKDWVGRVKELERELAGIVPIVE